MTQSTLIYYTRLTHPRWPLLLAATDNGFCFTGSLGKGVSELEQWAAKNHPGAQLVHDDEALAVYADQFNDYFDGKRTGFDFPLDIQGTPFQQSVWKALLTIPYGATRTYSDIAVQIHHPQAVRATGSAIGRNPVMIAIPCHRVLRKNGTLSGYRGPLEMKERLLELEHSYRKHDR